MRTITKTVYQFDELSDRAKETAREWYREGFEFYWDGDISDTLAAFENEFPVTAKDWQYSSYDYDVTANVTCDDAIAELSGVRLRTYLLNNHGDVLTGYKAYGSHSSFLTNAEVKRYRATSNIKRVSHIIKGDTSCPFTGVCYDESVLQHIRDFIKKPDGRTFADLLGDCLDSLFSDAQNEWEGALSDECVEDSIRANECEFYENGERI